ncbi:unnamed protein product [Gongylonema pulchrum]|uniref:RRM domain-containing protein n=1 Tax=Gongylonema pulchrum TaxID=637853 RepID=A0A183DWP1_9BILA|nr:unnamed protein product [Gongylonema pulchrum]
MEEISRGGTKIRGVAPHGKPKTVLEFAPCMRKIVAQRKAKSEKDAAAKAQSMLSPSSGDVTHANAGTAVLGRRRTKAEIEAFFKRLSTPKSVVTLKKKNERGMRILANPVMGR